MGSDIFTGASGKKYAFNHWDFPGIWNDVAGVYIIARLDRTKGQIFPIYIGETDNLKERLANHHRQDCFNKNKANVLCWLWETNQQSRSAIEADLLGYHRPLCNE